MKQSGFTLVELIIALLILSMVSILCASAFRFGIRVWDRVSTETQVIDNIQAAHGFLNSSISRALLQDQTDFDESRLENFFTGSSKALKYISYAPMSTENEYLYIYNINFNNTNQTLELTHLPFGVHKNYSSKPKTIILRDIEDVRFSYFSGFAEARGNPWSSVWKEYYTLPLLVKIDIDFKNSDRVWPELVIQMRNGPYVIR